MKNKLTAFELKRNLYFHALVLENDFKQNKNDLNHRNLHDQFVYKLIDSESGRKLYCKNFMKFK